MNRQRLFATVALLSLCSTCAPNVKKTPWRVASQNTPARGGPAQPFSAFGIVEIGAASSSAALEAIPGDVDTNLENPPPSPVHISQEAEVIFRWPFAATGINSLFGRRTDPIDGKTRFHYGVDLDGQYGTPCATVAPGFVLFAGWNSSHGRQVIIYHGQGYKSSYSHLSRILVAQGDSIAAGQAIGLIGNSGRSTGPHLHFELTQYDLHVDPLNFLGKRALGLVTVHASRRELHY